MAHAAAQVEVEDTGLDPGDAVDGVNLEVVVDWPHRLLERVGASSGRRDAVCVLTHDHKFDVPAIVAALATERRLPRCDGSRRTHGSGSSGCGRRASTARWPASRRRSGSTSAPARRGDGRSRSAPRSSPSAPGASPPLSESDGPIHADRSRR